MSITRRDFVHGGCTAAAVGLVPEPSLARLMHGTATGGVGGSLSRLVINIPGDGQLYLNLAKKFNFVVPPGSANQTSDGYPANGNLASSINANVGFPGGYYGKFIWTWTGTGAMESVSDPIIVYSGGTNGVTGQVPIFGIRPATSGDLSNNAIIAPDTGTAGITNPFVIFNYGWNIQSITDSGISNGTGGHLALVTVKSGFFNSGFTGTKVNVTGTGTSQDNTTTTITSQSATTFTLDGSTYIAGSGVAGTAVYAATNSTWAIYGAGQTFNNMSNLIICKYQNATPDDYTNITTNGLIADTVLVNQLKYLMNSASRGTPGWLRFMDLLTGARAFNGDYANRMAVTAMSYNPERFVNNYWAGTIANSSDAFSCSDPTTSTWGGSSYKDGAVMQGVIASTNTTGIPTLAVGGHPAAPIYYNSHGLQHYIFGLPSAPSGSGSSFNMSWTFNVGGASYLNFGSNYTFVYTPVAGDVGNLSQFISNLIIAINADPKLGPASIQSSGGEFSPPEVYIFGPTPLANGTTGAAANTMVITYFGSTTCNLYRIAASTMTGNSTFIYNALLQGWIYEPGGIGSNVPLEVLVDFCNRVGAHCWFNWDITTSAYVTSVTTYFANNLTSGLKFGTETGNELWNSTAFPYSQYLSLGACFGWSTFVSGQASLGYGGLLTVQYAAISRAAWATAGRSRGDHLVFSMGPIFDYGVSNNAPVYQWAGANMKGSSFPFYASYGGLGATSTADHFAAGTRPIDASDAIGCAPYWSSPWWQNAANDGNTPIIGTVAQNAPWLQASLDFTNGSTTTAFTSLVNQFNGTTSRTDANQGIPFGGTLFVGTYSYQIVFTGYESIAHSYDTYRAGGTNTLAATSSGLLGIFCYEGGPQWGMGASGVNGVNSVNSADINALASRMTALSWNVSAYTVSGTNNATECATQVITMAQAWKYDASYKNLIKTSYYQQLYNISGINREVHPAQYGYNASQWGLFPGLYSAGNQYTSYDAIHEWDA